MFSCITFKNDTLWEHLSPSVKLWSSQSSASLPIFDVVAIFYSVWVSGFSIICSFITDLDAYTSGASHHWVALYLHYGLFNYFETRDKSIRECLP